MQRGFFLFILHLLFISLTLNAQENSFELKFEKYKGEKDWDRKAELLIDICLESESHYYPMLKTEAIDLIVKGNNLGNKHLLNSGKFVYATIINKTGKNEVALRLLKENESYFFEKNALKFIAYTKIEIGNSFFYKGLPKEAIYSYNEAILLWKEMSNTMEMNHAKSLIANCYIQMGKLEEAKVIFTSCIDYLLPYNKNRAISGYYSQLGEIYSTQKEYKKSSYYFEKGAEYAFRTKDPATIARAKNYIAISHYYRGNKEKALEMFHSSLQYRIESHEVNLVCESYFNIGSFYKDEKQFTLAEIYFQKSIDEARKNGLLKDEADAYFELSEMHKEAKNFEKAYANLSIFTQLMNNIHHQVDLENKNENQMFVLLENAHSKEMGYSKELKLTKKLEKEKTKVNYFIMSSIVILSVLLVTFMKIKKVKI